MNAEQHEPTSAQTESSRGNPSETVADATSEQSDNNGGHPEAVA